MHYRRAFQISRLAVHTGFGATSGALLVALMVAMDAFGLGSLIQQNENPVEHLSVMLVKPVILFGLLAMGWSLWRQLNHD